MLSTVALSKQVQRLFCDMDERNHGAGGFSSQHCSTYPGSYPSTGMPPVRDNPDFNPQYRTYQQLQRDPTPSWNQQPGDPTHHQSWPQQRYQPINTSNQSAAQQHTQVPGVWVLLGSFHPHALSRDMRFALLTGQDGSYEVRLILHCKTDL